MNVFSTLKLCAFSCLFLCGTVTAYSQTCTGQPGTNCVAVTDQFATASFGQSSGSFDYVSGSYSRGGNDRGAINITSYTLNVQNNNFSVGAQITSGTNRISNTATIQILDAATSVVLCQTLVNIQNNGCLSAVFSNLAGTNVKINFIFNKTGNGGTNFDNFGTDPAQTVLPVNFISFNGKKTSKGTELTWKVGGEVNVKAYEVERSTNGNSQFTKIGSVPATGSDSYTFTDAAAHSGVVFYRVRNIDEDGKFKYTTVLSFNNGAASTVFKVVPTVVTSKTTVQHGASGGNASITLSTADGRVVRNLRPAAGAVQTDVDMSNLNAGLYILKWSNGNGAVETVKVVKQ